jgi:Lrp/AsnC family transcriptional regulator for asnA, asnC and gidA
MDKVDLQILNELAKNAQMPFSKIAKTVGSSPRTVTKRYKKMKEQGIILRSTVTVDLSKLGYQGRAFLNITIAPNRNRKETADALKQIKNIFLIAEIVGDFDFLAIGAVKDFKGAINLVNAIRKLPSVDQVDFSLTDDAPFPIDTGFERLLKTGKQEPHA